MLLQLTLGLLKWAVLAYAAWKLTPIAFDMLKADTFRQGLYRKQGGAQGTEFGYYWE